VGRSLLILLDTHVVLWLAFEEHRISRNAKTSIDRARQGDQGLAISDFTLYELVMAFRKKRIGISISIESFLLEVERRFVVLPITRDICVQTLGFPPEYPKDPGDRIIGATTIVNSLSLVTADQTIRDSGVVSTIW
jgi:PIN domain nuclease of toxin-antitoxin system